MRKNKAFTKIHKQISGCPGQEELPRRRHLEKRMARALEAGAACATQLISETGSLKRSRRMYRAMKASAEPTVGPAERAILEACFFLGIAGVGRVKEITKELRGDGFHRLMQAQQRLIQALSWLDETQRAKLFSIRTDVVGIGTKGDWIHFLSNSLAVARTARLLQERGLLTWFLRPKERADLRITLVATYQHRPGGLCIEIHGSRQVAGVQVDEAEFGSGEKPLTRLAERTQWFSRKYPGVWNGIRVHVGPGSGEANAHLPSWIESDRRRRLSNEDTLTHELPPEVHADRRNQPKLLPLSPEPGETLAACG